MTYLAVQRTSHRALFAASALVFTASVLATVRWSTSMSAMGGMPMPGGWTMSTVWMRMSGQSWAGMATTFLAMWMVMMIAMMLPSLLPMLARYRLAVVGGRGWRLGWLTATAGVAYLSVWLLFGAVAFLAGAALNALAMQQEEVARVVPGALGLATIGAGVLQLSAWKARHLQRCRESHVAEVTLPPDAGTAFRHGLRLGLHCSRSSASLMMVLLMFGVMDLRAMAVVASAITAERLAPAGVRIALVVGVIVMAAGLFLMLPASSG